MNKMIRHIGTTLGKALVLSVFALGLLVTAAVAFADQESGGEQQPRHHDELTFTQIDFPGAPFTAALGINNHSQIVGVYLNAEGGTQHGFLLDEGVFTQIDFPGAMLTQTFGINNRGQIVGGFVDSSGALHGFLATKEQFSGKASSVGDENATVEIDGTFTSPTDLDLSATTLTIANLLNELARSGELVSGLPLVLTAVPGSRRNFARFVDPVSPNSASVTVQDADRARSSSGSKSTT
jgi:hypothetical protein